MWVSSTWIKFRYSYDYTLRRSSMLVVTIYATIIMSRLTSKTKLTLHCSGYILVNSLAEGSSFLNYFALWEHILSNTIEKKNTITIQAFYCTVVKWNIEHNLQCIRVVVVFALLQGCHITGAEYPTLPAHVPPESVWSKIK